MKKCETCRYRNDTEYEKPCIVYRDDCEHYEKERGVMTREEALYKVKGYLTDIISAEDYSEVEEIIEALEQEPCGETVSLEAFKQVMWERDIAIEQLKELGYGFGQKIEPCNDLISRDELLKAIDTWDKFGVDDTNSLFRLDNLSLPHYVPYIHYDDVIKCIKGMSSVTPQEPKTGHWIKAKPWMLDNTSYKWECSECEKSERFRHNYCPNCGARMESEDKE